MDWFAAFMPRGLSSNFYHYMYLQRLSDKIWLTRNARFNAAMRMKRNHISSTAAVALLSASVIAVNLLAFISSVTEDQKILITIASVVLSTFALVMSLLIALLRYQWREDNYHQCGMELEDLNQHVQIRIDELTSNVINKDEIVSSKEDNMRYQEVYTNILKNYSLNHTTFDYKYGSLYDDSRQIDKIDKFWLYLRKNLFDVYLLYWVIAIIPIVVIIILFIHFI